MNYLTAEVNMINPNYPNLNKIQIDRIRRNIRPWSKKSLILQKN